ncbi:MAG: hypothetical protein HQK89_09530 [Nitrospirae bacterium]|nr:hypothetical protein [Nitrospirota bacterium]
MKEGKEVKKNVKPQNNRNKNDNRSAGQRQALQALNSKPDAPCINNAPCINKECKLRIKGCNGYVGCPGYKTL